METKLEDTVRKESDSNAATGAPQENAKAKFTLPIKKLPTIRKPNLPKIVIPKWIKRLARGIVTGFIIGLALNITDNYFWPDLDTTIPTIFGFFNGFVTLTEWAYKVTFGGFAALFNGNLIEFNKSVWAEFGEMLRALWNWMSSISF